MRARCPLVIGAVIALAALLACGGDDSVAAQGGEAEHCFPNDTCNDGLVCLSHYCVALPDAGSDGGGSLEDATVDGAGDGNAIGDAARDAGSDATMADAHDANVDSSPDSAPDAVSLDASPDATRDASIDASDVDAGPITQDWAHSFGSMVEDEVEGLAVDHNGNILVTGSFAYGHNGASTGWLQKLAPDGTSLWSLTPGTQGRAVAVDSAGNVYLSGYFDGSADYGGGTVTGATTSVVVKYDSAGHYVRLRRFANVVISALAVDATDALVIAGAASGATDIGSGTLNPPIATTSTCLLAKYDALGNFVFGNLYGSTNDQRVGGVVFDGANDVILAGYTSGSIDWGGGSLAATPGVSTPFLAKLGPSGSHIASTIFATTNGASILGIARDSSGNIGLAGYLNGTVDLGGGPLATAGNQDVFLAKLTPSWSHVWSARYGDTKSQLGMGVVFDSSDNMLATGWFAGIIDFGGGPMTSGTSYDAFLVKYDANGNYITSASYGGAQADAWTIAAIGNDAIITGTYASAITFGQTMLTTAGSNDVYVARVSP